MMRQLRFIATMLALLVAPASPALASQATLVTPGAPLSMSGLASFLNSAFLSVGSCNAGNSAPANGTGDAAFAGECWINTTSDPWVFSYTDDGTHWAEFGTLDTSSHLWTPYFGGNPTNATAPLVNSVSGGVLELALQYDSNFTNNGSNKLAFASIGSGDLLANSSSGSAEPTQTTPSAWLDRWCASTQYDFAQRGASSWACGTVSQLLIAGTGISLSGSGQVTVALANQLAAGGPTGDATHVPVVTYNAQGQLTAVTSVLVNPFAQVASPTSNAIYKGQGSSTPVASGLTDDGSKVSTSEPVDLTNQALVTEIANAGTTGTTLHALAKLTGAPSTAVITATTDTGGAVGIVIGGAGTSGNALVATQGQASCIFDGATTAGDYVEISSTTAGDCHDAGSSFPSVQTIGRVLSTNASGGTYAVALNTEIKGGSGGSGGVSSVTLTAGSGLSSSGTCNSTSSINCTVSAKDGGWVLLNTLTASNSASLTDTTSITGSYSEYEIVLEQIVPSTNLVTLEFQVQVGGSFQSSSYLSVDLFGNGSTTGSESVTTGIIASRVSNVANSGPGASARFLLSNPAQTLTCKYLYGGGINYTGSALMATSLSGCYNGGSGAITGIQLVASSGNLATGVMKIYGRVN